MIRATLLATMALAGMAAPVQAVECELHVWPSGQISAVDKDNHVSFLGSIMELSSSYTADPTTAQGIAGAVSPARQLAMMQEFGLDKVAGLGAFKPVFHEGEVAPADYPKQWLDKTFAQGPRLSDSQAGCYAEMHVVFVTYVDQPLKDTLHTIFVLRWFGPDATTRAIATDGGYHKAADVAWGSAAQGEAGRAALAASFRENLTKFFKRRKVVRLLGTIAGETTGG